MARCHKSVCSPTWNNHRNALDVLFSIRVKACRTPHLQGDLQLNRFRRRRQYATCPTMHETARRDGPGALNPDQVEPHPDARGNIMLRWQRATTHSPSLGLCAISTRTSETHDCKGLHLARTNLAVPSARTEGNTSTCVWVCRVILEQIWGLHDGGLLHPAYKARV